MDDFTPTKYTTTCTGCHRLFIISQETLDIVKRDAVNAGDLTNPTDEEAAEYVDWCVECVSGEPCPDERLPIAWALPIALRRGWALVCPTCYDARDPSLAAIAIGEPVFDPEKVGGEKCLGCDRHWETSGWSE
jgi:hypothetical protein